jgi:hypothetical protein
MAKIRALNFRYLSEAQILRVGRGAWQDEKVQDYQNGGYPGFYGSETLFYAPLNPDPTLPERWVIVYPSIDQLLHKDEVFKDKLYKICQKYAGKVLYFDECHHRRFTSGELDAIIRTTKFPRFQEKNNSNFYLLAVTNFLKDALKAAQRKNRPAYRFRDTPFRPWKPRVELIKKN